MRPEKQFRDDRLWLWNLFDVVWFSAVDVVLCKRGTTARTVACENIDDLVWLSEVVPSWFVALIPARSCVGVIVTVL